MRKLNAVTKPIFFPLPLLEDVFQLAAENNASVYSTIDLSFGYYQLFLEDSSKPKTGFVTHRGSYQYTRVCFGLQGAPASFNYLMHHILRNILFSYALTYVDDCMCFSSSPEKHIEHLTEIFNRFRQANLRLNPTKSKFGMAEVIYLGHKLRRHGVSACEDKLEVIWSFHTPKNAHQLRSYLGIANCYRRFVEKFSMKTPNLRSLLKHDAKFVWNSVHNQEFEFLKMLYARALFWLFRTCKNRISYRPMPAAPEYLSSSRSWMTKATNIPFVMVVEDCGKQKLITQSPNLNV